MKFVQVGFKKCMVKVNLDSGVDQWMDIVGDETHNAEAVKKLISGKFKKGDEIKLDYTQNGQDFQVKSVILDKGQVTDTPKQSPEKAPVKEDDKITTGKVTQKSTYTPSAYKARNTGESIEKQCAAKATAEIIKALTGRVDENNVIDLIEKIYNKVIDKIQG